MTENNIDKILEKDGVYVSTTSGVSMYPMLRDRRDTVIIQPPLERLKKYDVALFHRGDKYVLHRVIKVMPDSYIIRGDNCIATEHVKDSDVIGKLVQFYRADREKNMNSIGYKLYSRFIVLVHPFVKLKLRFKARIPQRRL